jgi:Fe-S oxidoreductase
MNPIAMSVMLLSLAGLFAFTASRRWRLLRVGRPEDRFNDVIERIKGTLIYAFAQKKMGYYPLAGIAHKLIFAGFLILLFRSLILWGRGFDAGFNMLVLGPHSFVGGIYEFLKDIIATLVIAGSLVFVYYRAIRKEARMTLSGEGLLILGIIIVMMLADMLYDGATIALWHRHGAGAASDLDASLAAHVSDLIAPYGAATATGPVAWAPYPSPAGSAFATALAGVGTGLLVVLAKAGFWTHATLVMVFLNLLPRSKHFHVITAIPNAFTRNIDPPGRLPFMGSTEKIMETVEAYAENPETAKAPVGIARIDEFTWKAILDFYTCTECGRCSDNCPAHKTGKILSPKQFTLDLRDHLYAREAEFLEAGKSADGAEPSAAKAIELVGATIHPDVLWGCTTCRACEEQCPVMISYVDKIVEMRRNLVMIKGEFPAELAGPFQAMEVNGNPWNLARVDRGGWADGLDVPTMADNPTAEVLYWVGCAASYDDRAKKIARAMAKLLKHAKVDFAILAQEETCTGDPARRAGNEFLFASLAEQNAATLNGYKEQGGIRKIVTACPHGFNTLKNEYPDFGAKFEVVHHTDFLLGLMVEKKLVPNKRVEGRVVFHDSCYLGRYNDVYEQPRDILRAIPGVELVEAEGWNRQKGMCCGAGGAQMWMEEQNKDRVNVKRTLQLLETKATTIATGCPFCQTMITDGLKAESKEDVVKQLDVVELLEQSCLGGEVSIPAEKETPEAVVSA